MSNWWFLLGVMAFALGISTVVGAAAGLCFRRLSHLWHDIFLGAACGIMLAAAILGLIVPAVELETSGALLLCVAGVFSGALLISLLDRLTPHLHHIAGIDTEVHHGNRGHSKVLLFVLAIAVHKIPEGLAAGVSFGTGSAGDVITVGGALVMQNIPEAMVIIVPLLSIGISVKRTLLISCGIGAISMVATIAGFGMVSLMHQALPFMLGAAGGAMLYVISDEMIPETHSHGYEKSATFALITGFMLVLIIQMFV